MKFLNKSLFIAAHQIQEKKFLSTYRFLLHNQWEPYKSQIKLQEKKLQFMLNYCYENIPFYHNLFNKINLTNFTNVGVESLDKIPLLNKKIINENIAALLPRNFNSRTAILNSTGGTTGTPLQFYLSNYDRFLSAAVLYRGWGYGGYSLSDKMVFLGGASLNIHKENKIVNRIEEYLRNIRKLSSFDLSLSDLHKYQLKIYSFKPLYLRGYASSLMFMANNLPVEDVPSTLKGIFSTSEQLHEHVRNSIEDKFQVPVYDNYGLNDGGVTAFECREHAGLHIDTERSLLEVVNDEGIRIKNEVGRIIATNLENFTMPLIRYDTGDQGEELDYSCECGRGAPLLSKVQGRSVDVLFTPEGKQIHGWFFLYIFWKYCKGIVQYQVIQKDLYNIEVNLIINAAFDESQLQTIENIMRLRSEGWVITFNYVDKIISKNKHKFIINEHLV